MNPMSESRNPLRNGKVIGHVDPRVYHRREESTPRGHPQYVMSFSELSEFAQCPARWIAGYKQESTPAMDWGDPLDCMLLTPELFDAKFAVTPETYEGLDRKKNPVTKPWRFGADATDNWKAEKEGAGLKVLHHSTYVEVMAAVKILAADPEVASLLDASQRQVMVVSTYTDPESEIEIPLRSLVDILPVESNAKWGKCVADFKTCANAGQEAFTDAIYRMQYHAQLAFYLDALRAAGQDRTDCLILAQESFPPWQTGHRHLSSEVIEFGRLMYHTWLDRYARCLRTGKWGNYEDGYMQLIPGWSRVEFTKPWQME